MAGHARYTVVFDACVLYPMVMADAMMSLTVTGLFAAKWTRRIEDEWMQALIARRPDLQGRLGTRRDQMRAAAFDWEIEEVAWQPIAPSLALPDPDDTHVLAAAIAGHADCIITTNLRDFPTEITAPLGVEVLHPDPFIEAQWDLNPIAALTAFKRMRARWQKPEASALEFAEAFERGGLPMAATRLREAGELL